MDKENTLDDLIANLTKIREKEGNLPIFVTKNSNNGRYGDDIKPYTQVKVLTKEIDKEKLVYIR